MRETQTTPFQQTWPFQSALDILVRSGFIVRIDEKPDKKPAYDWTIDGKKACHRVANSTPLSWAVAMYTKAKRHCAGCGRDMYRKHATVTHEASRGKICLCDGCQFLFELDTAGNAIAFSRAPEPQVLTHHFHWGDALLIDSDETGTSKFAAWSADIGDMIASLPLHSENLGEARDGEPAVICGEIGTGAPQITNTRVCFNGDAQERYAGQPFILSLENLCEPHEGICATNGHPYDLLVMAALLRLFHYFPVITIFSSGEEAGWTDWSEAAQLCVCRFQQLVYPISLICREIG